MSFSALVTAMAQLSTLRRWESQVALMKWPRAWFSLDLATMGSSRLPPNVKRLRIVILVLLSVLLPIRGALAATMLCADGAGTGNSTSVVAHEGHGMHAGHAMQAGDAPAHQHAVAEAPNADASSADHATTCHLCASGCCMASIVGAVPTIAQPGLNSTVIFPTLDVRVPAFQSDGQERPPRTI
jgi:hypothetical protein